MLYKLVRLTGVDDRRLACSLIGEEIGVDAEGAYGEAINVHARESLAEVERSSLEKQSRLRQAFLEPFEPHASAHHAKRLPTYELLSTQPSISSQRS